MITKAHLLIITENLNETAEFYISFFGFKEVFTSDWYLQLRHESGAELAVMVANHPSQPLFLHKAHRGEGIVHTFETDDAAEVYEKIKAQGGVFKLDLQDEEWGQRHFILEDPSGVYVDVVQYL